MWVPDTHVPMALEGWSRSPPSPQAEEEQACPGPQEEEEEVRVLTLPLQAHHAMEKIEEFVYKVLSQKGGSGLTRLGLRREHRTFINTLKKHS